MADVRAVFPEPDSNAVARRRRMVEDLAPYLQAIRDLTDPSLLVVKAVGVPAYYQVATEPLRGPVLRALGRAWHCASAGGSAGLVQADQLDGGHVLVQVHGSDWSLLARTGGPALCLFDGPETIVVDVSSTDLIAPLVQALLRAARRPGRGHAVSGPSPSQSATQPIARTGVPDRLIGVGPVLSERPTSAPRRLRRERHIW